VDEVLVTGGSGFIALHCIQQLLSLGFKVRCTVRSEKKRLEVIKAMKQHSPNSDLFTIVFADLLNDEGWEDAVKGCKYVLHTASPFVTQEPVNEDILIRPAVDGTIRLLNACTVHQVEKVVFTSSFAAIGYGHAEPKIYDESDWTQYNHRSVTAYAKSKTLAERTAWDFVQSLDQKRRFKLTVLNPVGVMGPMLSDDIGTTNAELLLLLKGKLPRVPKLHIGWVDVRDVARAHITAMTCPKTDNERIILCKKELWLVEIAQIFRTAGFMRPPIKEMPNFIVRILALFIKDLSGIANYVGQEVYANKEKAKDMFDWEFITIEESASETAYQLDRMGLIH